MNQQLKSFVRKWLPRHIHKNRIWSGRLRGKWIVTSWHDYPSAILGRNERPLLEWLWDNVQPDETWLDIGTHYGYVALALSNLVGASGRVFAFEPMLRTAGYVQKTRQLNNIPHLTVVPVGLGAPETFSIQSLSTVRGMIDSTLPEGHWQETFYVARLDWFWPRICGGNSHVDGIKIDVQGMEIDALCGMQSLLETYQPKLVIEIHQGVSRTKLLHLIEKSGYSLQAVPIDSADGEGEQLFRDNRSYVFTAHAS